MTAFHHSRQSSSAAKQYLKAIAHRGQLLGFVERRNGSAELFFQTVILSAF